MEENGEGSVAVEEKAAEETKTEQAQDQKPQVNRESRFDKLFGAVESGEEPPPEKEKEEVEADKKEEEKDSKPSSDDAKVEDKKDEDKEDPKEKGKVEVEEKSSIDWDSDDNPYKKQYNDTRDWATKINQELVDVKNQSKILGKKIDGTYDPEEEAKNEPTPEQVQADSKLEGRVTSSLAVANHMYGEENIKKLLFAENAPFKKIENDPAVSARVMNSQTPVLEAINVLKEKAFFSKYGNDPDAIKSMIEKEVTERLTKEITEKVSKELSDKISLKGNLVKGVSTVRGSNGQSKEGSKLRPESRYNKLFS